LRERRSDFPALVHLILEQLCSRHSLPKVKVEETAIQELFGLSFDGNLVELETLLLSILLGGAAKRSLDGRAVQKALNAERHSGLAGDTHEGIYRIATAALSRAQLAYRLRQADQSPPK
jgi:DNA-binding NtrC family response regulator